jgi:hypothetical protein
MPNVTRRAALTTLCVAAASPVSWAMDMADEIQAESAMRNAARNASRITHIRRVPSVGVVSLNIPTARWDANRNYMDASDFRIVADRHAAGIARMRRAFAANPVTRAAIIESGVDLDDVVGVIISSGGSLRLFVLR